MKTILAVSLLILCSACASLRSSPHYAIVADQSVTLRDDSDFPRVAEVGKTESNDFVWFVDDGREYVVDDPSFVAEAKRLAGNTFGFRSLIDPSTTRQYRRDIVGDPQNPALPSVGAASGPAGGVREVDNNLDRLFAKGLAAGVAKTVSPTSTVQYAIVTPTEVVARDAQTSIDHLRALRASAPNDLLWFERNGVQYIVSDPATVARAADAATNVEREYAELHRMRPQTALSPALHYYLSGAASGAAPPPPTPNQQEYETQQQQEMERTTENQLPRFTREASEDQFYVRKQQESVARAEKKLRAILDAALRSGLAQPMS